jgi:AcrR family transcriptional regulator
MSPSQVWCTKEMPPSRQQGQADGLVSEKFAVGRGRLGRERVSEIQRARMLSAMVEVVAERGAGNATVAHVVARSGVSRRTFYELFDDREDCFLAAFDDAVEKLAALVVPAYERENAWREKIRAGLIALLELLDYDRGTGRLVIVETLGAGPRALERRGRVLAQVIARVDGGRREAKKGDGPPPLTAEGVVGAVLAVIHARMVARMHPVTASPGAGEGNTVRLTELANTLMAMIVLPYLGPAAARRELARPLPAARYTSRRSAPANPLHELEMRLTYRTVRVLMAVAANPGSSNRVVGSGSGISDQGQISKLLARLHGLGLVENTGAGPARGEPNAWTLTAEGWDVHAAIAQQAGSD